MLRKVATINWDGEPSQEFQDIKASTKNALVLRTPYYTKLMDIFSFSSFHTVVAVLLQKNAKGYEQSIAFLIKSL